MYTYVYMYMYTYMYMYMCIYIHIYMFMWDYIGKCYSGQGNSETRAPEHGRNLSYSSCDTTKLEEVRWCLRFVLPLLL